jgi:hypothetical protein
MSAVATQTRITISSVTQGNIRLRRCKSSKVSDGAKTTAVMAMGEDDPIAFTDAPGAKTIALEVYEEQGKPEIDYRKLKAGKEVFSITREIVGGNRYQYPQCRVSTVEPDDDDEGKHMLSVEIIALSEKPL